MRFKKLDLNLLVALNALLAERNVTRASERMHLSQSAMSNALARLRDYFQDDLLVQIGNRMELTPRAEALYEAVRDVLVRIDTSIAAQPEFDPAESDREFTLFVSDYSMTVLIPHVLALATQQRSRVRFRLKQHIARPHLDLERGDADLLIVPKTYCSPDHPTETLFDDHFVCVLWRDSELAKGELTLERYLDAGHVVMSLSDDAPPAFENWLTRSNGISRRVELSTFSFAAIPFLVAGTELIGTVHARLAKRMLPSLPIVLRPVPMPMAELQQAMQWHKYRAQDPGMVWLRSLMHQAAQSMNEDDPSKFIGAKQPGEPGHC